MLHYTAVPATCLKTNWFTPTNEVQCETVRREHVSFRRTTTAINFASSIKWCSWRSTLLWGRTPLCTHICWLYPLWCHRQVGQDFLIMLTPKPFKSNYLPFLTSYNLLLQLLRGKKRRKRKNKRKKGMVALFLLVPTKRTDDTGLT